MKLIIDSIERQEIADDYPYDYDGDIEPTPWEPSEGEEVRLRMEERKQRFMAGEWWMIGIRAVATLRFADEAHLDGHYLTQTIESPGLWGVESDAGEEYLESIYKEELDVLVDMLKAIGFSDADIEEKL